MIIYMLVRSDEYGNLDTVIPYKELEDAMTDLAIDFEDCKYYADPNEEIYFDKYEFYMTYRNGARVWDTIISKELVTRRLK